MCESKVMEKAKRSQGNKKENTKIMSSEGGRNKKKEREEKGKRKAMTLRMRTKKKLRKKRFCDGGRDGEM